MSTFRAAKAREAAEALANQRAALKAQQVRNEAVKNAPVDSGRLRQSISVQKMNEGAYRVGTNVEYALWVEFGTRRRPATPFLRPAAEVARNG